MSAWLRGLLGRDRKAEPVEGLELSESAEMQRVSLELREWQSRADEMEREMLRLRERAGEQAGESGRAQMERLLHDLSRPLCLLLAVLSGPESEIERLQDRWEDAGIVVNQMIRVLSDYGWQPVGQVAQVVPFDLNSHLPQNPDERPRQGQMVVISCPGASLSGKVLLRAGVTLAPKEEH